MNTLDYFFAAFDFLLNQNNLSQLQFAEKIGMQTSAISRAKKGHRKPGTDILDKIANGFNYELVDFLILGRKILSENKPKCSSAIGVDDSFVAALKYLLQSQEIDMIALAEEAECLEKDLLEMLETGKPPKLQLQIKIARALGYGLPTFLGLTKQSTRQDANFFVDESQSGSLSELHDSPSQIKELLSRMDKMQDEIDDLKFQKAVQQSGISAPTQKKPDVRGASKD